MHTVGTPPLPNTVRRTLVAADAAMREGWQQSAGLLIVLRIPFALWVFGHVANSAAKCMRYGQVPGQAVSCAAEATIQASSLWKISLCAPEGGSPSLTTAEESTLRIAALTKG